MSEVELPKTEDLPLFTQRLLSDLSNFFLPLTIGAEGTRIISVGEVW
jgi:hypothetical protein